MKIVTRRFSAALRLVVPIASDGTFKAAVGERFAAGPGAPAIVQLVTGRFSGGAVRGTIHTRAGECGGVANFSATAR